MNLRRYLLPFFVLFLVFFLLTMDSCKKKEFRDGFTSVTFKGTVDITQFQCLWWPGYTDDGYVIYVDLLLPGDRWVTGIVLYDMQGSFERKMEMGALGQQGGCAQYLAGSCSESDLYHIGVGVQYEWVAYLICECQTTTNCGSDFPQVTYHSIGGGFHQAHLLASGKIIPQEKPEKNIINMTLTY